jgi:flagellar biosynthetic protein FliR
MTLGGLSGTFEPAALLWGPFLVFLRIGAIVALMPVFGERSVSPRIKLMLALAFTAIVFPAVGPSLPPTNAFWGGVLTAGAEVLSGVLFGLLLRFFVLALQTAGTIAAQATTLAQIFGAGPGAEPQPAFGNVLVVGGLALAAGMGLHVDAARYMIGGYDLVPPGAAPAPSVVAMAGVEAVSRTFALAFTLAAPFVIASFAYNLILGVINRAMPQLMVAFVGAPAITGAGLLLLFLATPLLLSVWAEALFGFMANPLGASP